MFVALPIWLYIASCIHTGVSVDEVVDENADSGVPVNKLMLSYLFEISEG